MSDDQTWTLKEYLFAMLAGAFVLVVNGAVPFLMLPTLGQAVWTTGFSQSFANGSLFDFYVHDFGLPKPAAIAFGLAGAWPASLLIRVGLHPADAYSGMAAAWFLLAMYSACRIAREFGASRVIALLGSVAWMTMPVIWEHAGYSMVSIGIALLPFYFFSACMLFLLAPRTTQITRKAIALYFTATIVAVFMDGYTFMMFATGASILLLYSLLARSEIRPVLIRKAIPVHVVSFALAYIIFSTYIGRSNFDAQPIDFFRGWGLDLSFIGIPTKGVLWLPDLLGLSVPRSNELHFGDASVWRTSFALPVLLLGLFSWWRTRTNLKVATGVLLVAVLGFYMALGPSLKINSTKPESLQLSNPRQQSSMMAADIAVMPTGSAWVSTTLPGFNVMRASYRWVALGVLASWFLIMISVSRKGVGNRTVWIFGLVALVLLNLPNIEESWRKSVGHRVAFHKIDRELVAEFRQHIQRGEKVAFIPWHNDFFANYLAPRGGFRTFNIGGDKNLYAAQSAWPPEMLALGGVINVEKAQASVTMLIDGAADVIVLPYFHMLWSPHYWPCLRVSRNDLGFPCPWVRRAELQPVVHALAALPYVQISDNEFFATVRLRSEYSGSANRYELLGTIFGELKYPVQLGQDLKQSRYLLRRGWHAMENQHVWSTSAAEVRLPVPDGCEAKDCHAVLKFAVFGAGPQRPVSVFFESVDLVEGWTERVVASSDDANEVRVPLKGAKGAKAISITVPDATSPQLLNGSPDARVLGIALQRIDLIKD